MSLCVKWFGLGDRRDQNTLEKLQAELLGKINELKERTNYYTTQQLIQVKICFCVSEASSHYCILDSIGFLVCMIISNVPLSCFDLCCCYFHAPA